MTFLVTLIDRLKRSNIDQRTYNAFSGFTSANTNVCCLDTAKVTTMENMFQGASLFNIDTEVYITFYNLLYFDNIINFFKIIISNINSFWYLCD